MAVTEKQTLAYLISNGIDPDETIVDQDGKEIPFLTESGTISPDAYRAIIDRERVLDHSRERLVIEFEIAAVAARGIPGMTPESILRDRGDMTARLAEIVLQLRRSL